MPLTLWCDFNACGYSGLPDDNCFYAFDKAQLAALNPKEGLRVLLYTEDSDTEVLACDGILEWDRDRWRARPVEGTWRSVPIQDVLKRTD